MTLRRTFDFYPYLRRVDLDTFAEYYRYGAEYLLDVTEAMAFDAPGLESTVDAAYQALRENAVPSSEEQARSVGAVLLGDAEWFFPLADWLPRGARLANKVRCAPLVYVLRTLGHRCVSETPFETPTFSRPAAVELDGRPAVQHVDGRDDRLVLATSILHLEWYVDVAERHGVDVPASLVDRTRRESKRYFTGRTDDLSREVKDFQYWLFQDVLWIRKFESTYGGLFGARSAPGASGPLWRVLEEDLV